MLLDSNIIIYAAHPEHEGLLAFITERARAVSVISVVEVLGYHGLTQEDRADFEAFFRASRVLPVSDAVVERAVRLRQQRRMSLGDALIAGTAIAHDLTLVTRNASDFAWITDLRVHDPFASRQDAI